MEGGLEERIHRLLGRVLLFVRHGFSLRGGDEIGESGNTRRNQVSLNGIVYCVLVSATKEVKACRRGRPEVGVLVGILGQVLCPEFIGVRVVPDLFVHARRNLLDGDTPWHPKAFMQAVPCERCFLDAVRGVNPRHDFSYVIC
jgi:hypothetical protein